MNIHKLINLLLLVYCSQFRGCAKDIILYQDVPLSQFSVLK